MLNRENCLNSLRDLCGETKGFIRISAPQSDQAVPLLKQDNSRLQRQQESKAMPAMIQNQGMKKPIPICPAMRLPAMMPRMIPSNPPIWQITIASVRNW